MSAVFFIGWEDGLLVAFRCLLGELRLGLTWVLTG